MVFAPASGGEIGIAPRHAPLLSCARSKSFASSGWAAERQVESRHMQEARSEAA